MLHTEVRPLLLRFLHGLLKDVSRVRKSQLRHARKLVSILEVRLLLISLLLWIVDLGVDASLRLIFHPLSNEELVL